MFGCDAYPLIPNILRRKWDAKSTKLIFVGYENESDNYRLLNIETGRVTISKSATFNENFCKDTSSERVQIFTDADSDENDRDAINAEPCDAGPIDQLQANNDPENDQVPPIAEIEPPEIEAGDLREGALEEPLTCGLRPREAIKIPLRYQACTVTYDPPRDYKDALSCDDADLWKQAIREELAAHSKNKTWSVCELPEGRKPIGFKWVFIIKNLDKGDMQRYKARLCAQGFSQRIGIDYDEVFSPVVHFDSIRVLLAIAVKENLKATQFDVSTAYLNSELNETIFMRIPDGLEIVDRNLVLKLNKSINGLKQSGRCWNAKFDCFMKRLNLV